MEGNMWVFWYADKCSKSLVGLHTWQQLIGIWVFGTQNQQVYWGYMISLYIVHLYICWNVTLWPQNMYRQVSIKNYINSPSLSPQKSRWQAVLYSLGRVLPFSLRIGFSLQCWKDSGGLNPPGRWVFNQRREFSKGFQFRAKHHVLPRTPKWHM